MSDYETTSDLRQGCFMAITSHALADPDARPLLAAELEKRDYQGRSDDELIDLCYRLGVPEAKVTAIAQMSATRRPDHVGRFLCGECLDIGVVQHSNGERSWFERCLACNPEEAE